MSKIGKKNCLRKAVLNLLERLELKAGKPYISLFLKGILLEFNSQKATVVRNLTTSEAIHIYRVVARQQLFKFSSKLIVSLKHDKAVIH